MLYMQNVVHSYCKRLLRGRFTHQSKTLNMLRLEDVLDAF